MKTKELIEALRDGTIVFSDGWNIKDEIIQRLLEYDELKRVIQDTVDTAIELYSFLFAVTGEFE